MKKKIITTLICLGLILGVTGCGSNHPPIYESYYTAIRDTNNEYFKTKIIYIDEGGSWIIQNELTEEYFLCVTGVYGVSITPIKVERINNGN